MQTSNNLNESSSIENNLPRKKYSHEKEIEEDFLSDEKSRKPKGKKIKKMRANFDR